MNDVLPLQALQTVVLIPCHNEELTIGKVIADFSRELPDSKIYVFDNNSSDATAKVARRAGASVVRELRQGKGNVIRSMFREIEADLYVIVDGDDTYPAEDVHKLIDAVVSGEADMAVGDRHSNESYSRENTRRFHNFGNHLVRGLINLLFRSSLRDIMSGYRVCNRYFGKTMPVLSKGFEVETEMTLHALDKRFLIKEIPITYRERPKGSFSKVNTIADGIKIVRTIFGVFQHYRPFAFFGTLSAVLFAIGAGLGIAPLMDSISGTEQGLGTIFTVLSIGVIILSFLFLNVGFILHSIVTLHRADYELELLRYRAQPSPIVLGSTAVNPAEAIRRAVG